MKNLIAFTALIFLIASISMAEEVVFKVDDGSPRGDSYTQTVAFWEESVALRPDGPCRINKIQIYLTGDVPGKDTLWICGFPPSGNLWPTQYIWDFNTLIEPIEIEYSGEPGWLEIDVSETGLKSDGLDVIVIQHILKPDGPRFVYDSDGRHDMPSSWMTDPFTPNPGFFDIVATIYKYPPGDYMARLVVEYDFPDGDGSLPPPAPKFVEVTSKVGLSGGGYASAVDFDKDGDDDIALGGALFRNLGDGTFEKVGDLFSANGTTWGDYDNDGDIDCYAARTGTLNYDEHLMESGDALYAQVGDGEFEKLATRDVFTLPYPDPKEDFNLPSPQGQDEYHNPYHDIAPVFLDYNGDGYLDIFIANRRFEVSGRYEINTPDQLWKNNGDGTFTNVRDEAGIPTGEPLRQNATGPGMWGYYDCYGACACDYNKDNLIDIFVANYRLAPDNLYKNNGDGTLVDVGEETGVRGEPTAEPYYFGHGMGAEWGDLNNDALPDLVVGNLAHTDSRGQYSNPSLIYINNGPPNWDFEDKHKQMGLKFYEGNAGVCLLDMDLDGYLDVWHGLYSGGINRFYLNQGPPDFKLDDVTWDFNARYENVWQAIRLDYDLDGDLDLMIQNRLYRNDLPHKGSFLGIRLEGSPENEVGTDAYGSKITVEAGGQTFYRSIAGSAAGTRTSQNSAESLFGLGDVETVDKVTIDYPNGESHELNGLAANARYLIPYKGQAAPIGLPTPSLAFPENYAVGLPNAITLEWDGTPLADSYNLILSKNEDFSDPVIDETGIEAEEFTYDQFENGSTYYWKVQAENEQETSAWSSVWKFIVDYPIPDKIALQVPENGAVDQAAKTLFVWEGVTFDCYYCSNVKYELHVSPDPEFQTGVDIYENISKTNFELPDPLDDNQTIYWKVRAINYDAVGEFSDVWSYTIMQKPGVATLNSPDDGETDVRTNPRFRWNEAERAEGYLLEVALDEDFNEIVRSAEDINGESFWLTERLDEGTEYRWRVTAVNKGGVGEPSESRSFTTEGVKSVSRKELIKRYSVSAAPNPFSDEVKIEFALESPEIATIEIFDALGNKVADFGEKAYGAGLAAIEWSPSVELAGVYFCIISIKGEIIAKKLVYLP